MQFPFTFSFSKKRWQDQWVEVHCTDDAWEAQLIKTLLHGQEIPCRPDHQSKIRIYVEPENETQAREVVSQVGVVIAEHQSMEPEPTSAIEDFTPLKAPPTDLGDIILAEKPGVGKVIHHLNQGFELQVGPGPYHIIREDLWEEFTDFSAQRQEFVILLRHEYPELLKWLNGQRLLPEFIRLIQSTYQDR